jgi:hypothetical protein
MKHLWVTGAFAASAALPVVRAHSQEPAPAGLTLLPAAFTASARTDSKPSKTPDWAADRPGLGDSTSITPEHCVALEMGYTYTYRHRDGETSRTHDGPEATARLGVCDDVLELRLAAIGYIYSHTETSVGTSTDHGFSDATAGLKVRLWKQTEHLPRVCLLASTTLGLGSRAVSNRDVEPLLEATWSYKLEPNADSGFELDGSIGADYASDSGDRFFQGFGAVSVTYQFNLKLAGFVEYFVIGPASRGGDAAHYVDVGVTYMLQDWIQLDASLGVGKHEANNLFAGAGISFLF